MQIVNFAPAFINATDLNDAYFSLIWELWHKGRKYQITSGSFAGSHRLEFDYCAGFIKFPHTRPMAPIMPEGVSPTTTDEKIESYFANYIMDSNLERGEHYRYSSWINGTEHYYEFYIDPTDVNSRDDLKQRNMTTPIEWVINHFRKAGYGNNHCYINIGNVDSGFNYDVPYKSETERRTSPCFRGIDFKIKEGQLITSVVFRSWDLFSGFPENMGGFTLLNEYVCEQLGDVTPGPLAFSCAGLHAYDYQLESIMAILHK
jgi:hypothetical protein